MFKVSTRKRHCIWRQEHRGDQTGIFEMIQHLKNRWKTLSAAKFQEAGENSDNALIQSRLIAPFGNHMTPKGARIIDNEIKKHDVIKHF